MQLMQSMLLDAENYFSCCSQCIRNVVACYMLHAAIVYNFCFAAISIVVFAFCALRALAI